MVMAMFAGSPAMSEEDERTAFAASPLPTARLGRLSAALRAEIGPSAGEEIPSALSVAGVVLADRLTRPDSRGAAPVGGVALAPCDVLPAAEEVATGAADARLRGRR